MRSTLLAFIAASCLLPAAGQIYEQQAIFKAIFVDDQAAVLKLLDEGADIHSQDCIAMIAGEYGTPLMHAAMRGRVGLVRLLLEKGARLEDCSNKGRTALMLAAYYGEWETFHQLIKAGAKLDHLDEEHCNILMLALRGTDEVVECNEVIVNRLLDMGVDVNQISKSGNSALSYAIRGKSTSLACALINKGADINHVYPHGGTMLMLAAENGLMSIVRLMLDKGVKDINQQFPYKGSALIVGTAFEKIALMLIDAGADIHAQSNDGKSVLMAAAEHGQNYLVERLLKMGAKIDIADRRGDTALVYAAREGQLNTVGILLNQGAAVSTRALAEAAHYAHNDTVKLLLEKGARIDHSVLTSSADARSNWNEDEQERAKVITLLLEYGADVKDTQDYSLIKAAESGHASIVRMLIEAGADINKKSPSGRTAFFEAATRFAWRPDYEKIVNIFLSLYSGDKAQKQDLTSALLSTAGSRGTGQAANLRLARLLLEHGADVHARNRKGETPYIIAKKVGHEEMMALMLEYGADVNATTKLE